MLSLAYTLDWCTYNEVVENPRRRITLRSWRVEIGRKDAEQSIQALNPRCPRRAASDALMLPLERCTQLPRRGVGGLSCRLTRQIIQPPSNRLHGSRAGVATHVHPLHSQQRRRATIGVGLRERSYAFSELLAVWPKCCWGGRVAVYYVSFKVKLGYFYVCIVPNSQSAPPGLLAGERKGPNVYNRNMGFREG